MEIVAEEWRSVEGYAGIYEVSSSGRIRSVDRVMIGKDGRNYHFRGRLLKACKGKKWGYWSVNLCDVATQKSVLVHVIVAREFIGPKPDGTEVNHKDGNKDNNASSNLEYVTHAENCSHYIAMGLRDSVKGDRHHRTKVTASQVEEIRAMRSSGAFLKDIAAKYGIDISTVEKIAKRKTWKHVA